MKILLSSYSFGAGRGSEAGVGWHVALGMAGRGHHVWVLTTSEFGGENRAALAQVGTRVSARLHLVERDYQIRAFSQACSYRRWQKQVGGEIATLCEQHEIEIVHHLTLNQYRYLHDVFTAQRPYLCGPLGGAECVRLPLLLSLWRDWPLPAMIKELLRYVAWDASWLGRRVRGHSQRGLFVASGPQTQQRLHDVAGIIDTRLNPIIAVEEALIVARASPQLQKPYFIYTGGLRPEKGLGLVLRAFVRLRQVHQKVQLYVVGVPKAKQLPLQGHLRHLGLAGDCVRLLPQMPQGDLHRLMQKALGFLCLNLRDSGCMALLEALALGLPSICLDNPEQWWLPPHLCDKIKVQNHCRNEIERELAEHMQRLCERPIQGAAWHEERVRFLKEEMSWERRLDNLETMYRELLDFH